MEFLNLFTNNFSHLKYKPNNFFLIAGPCVVESEEVIMQTAQHLVEVCNKHEISLIFKSSYRKANRSSAKSFTGIGDEKALELLKKVREKFTIPVITDFHASEEASMAANYVDALQIPAFLCRQSDILEAAAKTGKFINIKKGQFLSPEAMQFAVNKVLEAGNSNIAITDRGTCFGYHDLIVDYRAIPTMKKFNVPVIMDCTHSLQQPNQTSGITGGKPEFIETISKCAIAAGADGLFIETHPNPSQAKSDGANMLPLNQINDLLEKLVRVRQSVV